MIAVALVLGVAPARLPGQQGRLAKACFIRDFLYACALRSCPTAHFHVLSLGAVAKVMR
jgi:hypothetical protein